MVRRGCAAAGLPTGGNASVASGGQPQVRKRKGEAIGGPGGQADTITDFQLGIDKIEVSGYTSYVATQQGADTLVT